MFRINALEPALSALSDSELKAKTAEFRARLAAGEHLDALLPEAFAVVRETSTRVLGLRHFDVQLVSPAQLSITHPPQLSHCSEETEKGVRKGWGYETWRDSECFEAGNPYLQARSRTHCVVVLALSMQDFA